MHIDLTGKKALVTGASREMMSVVAEEKNEKYDIKVIHYESNE